MRKTIILGILALATLASVTASPSMADDTIKVGLIIPMTGPFASTGRQVSAGVKTFMAINGDTVAGKKIELVIRDDAGTADQTRRIAQELVVNEGVNVLAGFGLTPLAMAVAPVATQAKVPTIVMSAATSSITKASEYITRTSGTGPQNALPVGAWAAQNGIKRVVTLVSDYGPGIDSEKWFAKEFKAKGGEIIEAVRVPLANPDFAPFLQRVRDAKPDAVFVFLPSGGGALFMKQFADRGLAEAGVKLIAAGDVTDDDILNSMGKPAIGAITGHFYSADHKSPENDTYLSSFRKLYPDMRPNFMSVGGYDGMALIYKALEKTKGDAAGPALMTAIKGLSWISPRGPVSIDPETRDIIQNIYIREVKEVNGELQNVEFQTFPNLKDPEKAEAK